MKSKILLTLVISLPVFCFAQKVKTVKNPVGWSYQVTPKNALDPNLKRNVVKLNSQMDPLSNSDKREMITATMSMSVDQKDNYYNEARRDTIRKWKSKYLALKRPPMIETSIDGDVFIELSTDVFQVDNLQLDIDYSDSESVIGEINISARLIVRTKTDEILHDEQIKYYVDEEEKTTQLKLKQFLLSPTFKMRFKMAKKPEKKRMILENKIKNYEADILETFFKKGQKILKDNFIVQEERVYAATFGIKDKTYASQSELSEKTKLNINSLNAFSKKKRQTLEQIKPSTEEFITEWKKLTESSKVDEIKKVANANVALGYLMLGDTESARTYFDQIPESKELDNTTIVSGNFKYYLKGLADALAIAEKNGDRIDLYIP